ncbi:MAG: hypothetical protein IIZ39_03430 [Blautia sp.]|nr:hypothetical protein [Blautia sp.]
MKKAVLAVLVSFSLLMGGCTPGKIIEQVTGVSGADSSYQPTVAPSSHTKRVYMDEIIGPLISFDGNFLCIQGEEGEALTFDVTRAGLECSRGILGNEEVSLIYEGKTSEEDFHILKVTEALHQKEPLKDYVISGTLEGLTSYSVTVKDSKGNTHHLPSMARQAFFSKGMILGMPIFIKCLGENPKGGDVNHPPILVKAISDQESFKTMEAEPVIETNITDPYTQTQRMELTLDSIENGVLKVLPDGSTLASALDLNALPCFFDSGLLPGTRLVAYYTGSYNGQDLGGITISQLRTIDSSASHPTVKGTVLGITQDTVTLTCPDGAYFTFRNRGKNKLLVTRGEELSVTVNPSASKDTTIYTAAR